MPAPPGEKHHFAKLTADKVREMREWYARGDISILELSFEFGVNEHTTRSALAHHTWKTAGGPAYRPRVQMTGGVWRIPK